MNTCDSRALSGADGDGASGLTIAQDPAEAEHGGMPRSAIATGMVDWVLQAHEMPARLLECFAREKQVKLPREESSEPTVARPTQPPSQTPV